MNFKPVITHRTVDEKSYLGYSRCAVFEAGPTITVSDVFSNKLLSDQHDPFINDKSFLEKVQRMFQSISFENEFGPVNLIKATAADFELLTFDGLQLKLKTYWEAAKWGADLEVFQSNFSFLLHFLKEYDLENRSFYYLNMENVRKELLINPEVWIYFVGIFSVDAVLGNVLVLCFGND